MAMQLRSMTRARVILPKRRASIYSKPPKDKIGPGVSGFVVTKIFSTFELALQRWHSAHLQDLTEAWIMNVVLRVELFIC